MAHPALVSIGLKLAPVLFDKVVEEVKDKLDDVQKVGLNDDGEIVEVVDTVERFVLSKKKAGGWSVIAMAFMSFGALQGWWGQDVADFANTLLSNPEVVEAIESAVE